MRLLRRAQPETTSPQPNLRTSDGQRTTFKVLRSESAEATEKLARLIFESNQAGGTYHLLDFGDGLILNGTYDMRDYMTYYPLPVSLSGKKVLDIGTASGYFALECARRGGEVTAIDIWGQDALVPRYLSLLSANVRYVQKNIYDLAPEFGQFDLVICGSLLLHLPDQFGAIQRIRSVCRGEAIVSTACPPDSAKNPAPVCQFIGKHAAEADYWEFWRVGAVAMQTMMKAAGFSSVKNVQHFSLAGTTNGLSFDTPHVVMTGVA